MYPDGFLKFENPGWKGTWESMLKRRMLTWYIIVLKKYTFIKQVMPENLPQDLYREDIRFNWDLFDYYRITEALKFKNFTRIIV